MQEVTEVVLLGQLPFNIQYSMKGKGKFLSNLQNKSLEGCIHRLASVDSQMMLYASACYNKMGLTRKVIAMHIALS